MAIPKPPPPTPKRFTTPPNKSSPTWLRPALEIALFLAGLLAIYVLFASSPPEKKLVCRNSVTGRGSLTSFGSCTKE